MITNPGSLPFFMIDDLLKFNKGINAAFWDISVCDLIIFFGREWMMNGKIHDEQRSPR